jgi:glycosyltransferase involved in cell wall biosynthesis
VLPTRADLSPNTILEAMATGRPVVASRLCGIPDMVEDGVTGFLIPPDDPAALADRIARLLRDPALRQRMGNAARLRVQQRFSAATNVPRILALMKDEVERQRGARVLLGVDVRRGSLWTRRVWSSRRKSRRDETDRRGLVP